MNNINNNNDSLNQLKRDFECLLQLQQKSNKMELEINQLKTKLVEALKQDYKPGALDSSEDFKDYFSITGYIKYRKSEPVMRGAAIKLGKNASHLSLKQGLQIKSTEHPTFGTVNLYHRSILEKLLHF